MEKIIDLHIHTNISDGTLSPKQVIDEAKKNDVSIIAIADHDTIEAYNDELFEYAKSKNITLIKAVEISTKTNKTGIHVLGYNFDLENEELNKKLFELRNARHDYLYKVANILKSIGYTLNLSILDAIDSVTKAHIASDVIDNIQNQAKLLHDFGHIPTKGEFIETIMNEGCIAYVKKASITPKEAANLIRNANGKVILAHPVAYTYEDNLTEKDIYDLIMEMKADGIESNYIYIDRLSNKKNDIDKWTTFANKHNLISTIGSDFHTNDGIHPTIGLIGEDLHLSNSDIDKIIDSLLN